MLIFKNDRIVKQKNIHLTFVVSARLSIFLNAYPN